jgi:myotubularin-related protein 6/7/8
MRNSLAKLVEAVEVVNPANGSFYPGLEKSEWLKHIKAVIDTSLFITEAISNQNINVVVHCSDGWDRTAQTCAISSLLLDSYYRTIHGFQILIEKEWLTFGHKFSDRSGHLFENENSSKETSPIFQQFLECVWQISQQYPCAFEFNEKFLIKLHEHVYSCQFGTFIGNCQKERIDLRISEVTFSLWDYIQYKINDYINPLYVPNSVYSRQVLKPDTRSHKIKFWKGLYNRFDQAVHSNENQLDALSTLQNNTSFLNDYAKLLKKRCKKLKSSLQQQSDDQSSLTDSYIKVDEENNSSPPEEEIDKIEEIEKLENDFLLTNLADSPPVSIIERPKQRQQQTAPIVFDKVDIDFEPLVLDWSSFAKDNCACSLGFDYASAKVNCSKCGKVFCERCIEEGRYVMSQASTKLIFICQLC